jgi:hypothetical protein
LEGTQKKAKDAWNDEYKKKETGKNLKDSGSPYIY